MMLAFLIWRFVANRCARLPCWAKESPIASARAVTSRLAPAPMYSRFRRPPITAHFEKHCSVCRKDFPPPMNRRRCKTCKTVLKLICPCGKQLSVQGGHVYMHLQNCLEAQAVRTDELSHPEAHRSFYDAVRPRGAIGELTYKTENTIDPSSDEEEAAMVLAASAPVRPSAASSAVTPPPTPALLAALNLNSFVLPPPHSLPLMCAPSHNVDLRPNTSGSPATTGTHRQLPVAFAVSGATLGFPILRLPGQSSSGPHQSTFFLPRLPPPPADLT